MSKNNLYIFAGANGSGKSTHSEALLSIFSSSKKIAFDGDQFIKEYSKECDDEYHVLNLVNQKFKEEIDTAINPKTDFAYETNFHLDKVLEIPDRFKSEGYIIHCIFFVSPSLELSIERVTERHSKGGHYVSADEIENRFHKGYENIKKHNQCFDNLLFVKNELEITGLLHLSKGKIININNSEFYINSDSHKLIYNMAMEINKNEILSM